MFFWIFLLLLAGVAIWYYNQHQKGEFPGRRPDKKKPMETLRDRYARGEITKEEYEQRKAVLEEESNA